MNRREFLHTVSGAAMVGGVYSSGLDAAGDLAQPIVGSPWDRPEPARQARVAVFWEPAFPTIDVAPFSESVLRAALAGHDVVFLGLSGLNSQLARNRFDVLLMPYGSAFPKQAWASILAFLNAGGNWVNLGGVPCAVPVVGSGASWRPEVRQTSYHRALGITQAFPVTIPAGVEWETSFRRPWSSALLNQIRCARAYELYVCFSRTKRIPSEDGSDGLREAVIEPVLSAMRVDSPSTADASRWAVAAPVVLVDRLLGDAAGGRWVFFTGDGAATSNAISALTSAASSGPHQLVVQPTVACYRNGETATVTTTLERPGIAADAPFAGTLSITIVSNKGEAVATVGGSLAGSGPRIQRTDTFAAWPAGYYRVDGRLTASEQPAVRATTGVWVFDERVLDRGTPLSVDAVSLRRNGRPFVVTGTTYMASDTHRRFLLEPNPDVWDRDFLAMRRAGVNVVRTGLWTGWSEYMSNEGELNDKALRALDAFMLTAARYDISVVFTFFAFLPPTWGGANPYLDPRSIAAQKRFVATIAGRFNQMKDVTWDLINEPSFCSADQLWLTRPNYDEYEQRAWAAWLAERYPAATPEARELALQELWRGKPGDSLQLPALEDFTDSNIVAGRRPLKAADYRLFAQEMFRRWVEGMSTAIREMAGPTHLITVGQDEGGTGERPSNHFFGPAVDLTSIHTWWYNDDLLWDSVVSKHPLKPNLVQETGVMFYETADGRAWRTEEDVRDLFERKLALAVGVGGAGYMNWIWNTNPFMPSDNEAAIGLLRPDGTIKPEFDAWRGVTEFVRSAAPYLEDRQREPVLMIIPQANQFSVRTTAVDATKRAMRLMHYHCRVPMAAVGEFNIDSWPERPKLIVLPSPRILTRQAWSRVRAWVEQGSTLLVTGPFDEDEHWLPTGRMAELGLPTAVRPVMPTEFVAGDAGAAQLSFRGERIHRVETTAGGAPGGAAGFREDSLGMGRIIWVAAPIELAEESEFAVGVYRHAAQKAGVGSAVNDVSPGFSSILVYPAHYRDCTLYTVVSESRRSLPRITFGSAAAPSPRVSVTVADGRAALVLVDRKTNRIIADYPRGCASVEQP